MIPNSAQAETSGEPIVVDRHFAAAPAKVYRAWTDPTVVVKWFGHAPNSLHSAEIDLRPGGSWRFVESKDDNGTLGFEGEYLEIEHGKRLIFTWARVVTRGNGDREATLHAEVDVSFTAERGGTHVRLVHTVTRPEGSRRGIGDNWNLALGWMDALFSDDEP